MIGRFWRRRHTCRRDGDAGYYVLRIARYYMSVPVTVHTCTCSTTCSVIFKLETRVFGFWPSRSKQSTCTCTWYRFLSAQRCSKSESLSGRSPPLFSSLRVRVRVRVRMCLCACMSLSLSFFFLSLLSTYRYLLLFFSFLFFSSLSLFFFFVLRSTFYVLRPTFCVLCHRILTLLLLLWFL